ncbi:MAG: tyrosine--tRNA ligase [Parcubacteria group bacterium]|nr:tyrosine--tRNA ligase [Parcubacteria group bacterium]
MSDIKKILDRKVEEVIVQEELEKKLASGKKLRAKLGFDPSSPDIHLGHTVQLGILKAFQDLGHQIIFIIGDYTAKIGDPSGKSKTRPILSDAEIKENAQTYFDQVGKIIDVDKAEIRRNSEWFAKKNFADILDLCGKFTVARIIERDDFTNRLGKGTDVGLHELLYPVMQAYDSVEIKADVEVGGTDQKFNMLAGRSLQKRLGLPPQDVITGKLLVGLDGTEKMSKSLDNYIGLTEEANSMYGKVMSIPDKLIINYFELATQCPEEKIAEVKKQLEDGKTNPRDLKAELAREIVTIYHDKKAAGAAEEEFTKIFTQKEKPSDIKSFKLPAKSYKLVDLLPELELASSKGEGRRLIEQGAVKIDDKVVKEWDKEIKTKSGMVVQAGKRRFAKIAA